MKNLSILGSTGSIGTQTLEVVRNNPNDFRVISLTANKNISLLIEQIIEFKPILVACFDSNSAKELRNELMINHPSISVQVEEGLDGIITAATMDEVDTVVGAIVGMAGFLPIYYAINANKNIALANKETLVAGGNLIMSLVYKKNVSLLPIDSEHAAIWQCLWGERKENLSRILLTASGGPFRGYTKSKLEQVTINDALNHPTWNMGGKITIDSATMMNKGLEVIEAHHLFNVNVDQIDVVVHPQSIIHSMITLKDGSCLAQMGKPSMVLPIMVALYYPDRGDRICEEFDPFANYANNLTFERCDTEVFSLLKLAYDAGRREGFMPLIMNAANEISVYAFLRGEIGFLDIERSVNKVYDYYLSKNLSSYTTAEEIINMDKEVRLRTKELLVK